MEGHKPLPFLIISYKGGKYNEYGNKTEFSNRFNGSQRYTWRYQSFKVRMIKYECVG